MRFITKLFLFAFLIGSGTLFYLWHKEQKTNRFLLEKIKIELEKERAKIGIVDREQISGVCQTHEWRNVHDAVRDSVAQIFVYKNQFNWLEPYKTPKQTGATGSGFFIDESGFIMTNAHVVDQGVVIYIQIPSFGKRRFDVELIGVSPDRDLALLKVIPEDLEVIISKLGKLPILKFGDSDLVRRADEIMTLGYPLGQQSLKSTVGVVSGVQHLGGRSMIQIDAAINPGNSGGPSLSKSGEVVGVNTIGVLIGGAQNVGYIISSNEAKLFLEQLKETKTENGVKFLRKPFLGVIPNVSNETTARYFGNPSHGGVYVAGIFPESPASKAGIMPGDMMYEIDGHAIDYFGELQVRWSNDRISIFDYAARLKVGSKIHMVIYRNGVRKEIIVNFDFLKHAPIRKRFPGYEPIDYELVGGLVVMPLSINHIPLLIKGNASTLAPYMNLEQQLEPALLITNVLPDSAASRTRILREGLLLKEVNGKETKTLEEFRTQVRESFKDGFLTIKTKDSHFTVISIDAVLEEEKTLSRTYFYKISPFVESLIEARAA